MLEKCQKVEIKRIPHTHLASDITNFTSAVCAVFLNSIEFKSIYTTVTENSAFWGTGGGGGGSSTLSALTGNWEATYTTVFENSSFWQSVYTISNEFSGLWNSVYSTTLTNSANWESTYVTVLNNSSYWNDSTSSWASNSADIIGTYNSVLNNSSYWNDSYTFWTSNSADINNTFNVVFNNSSYWDESYNTVINNSAYWTDVSTSWTTNSGQIINLYTSVFNNSALWDSSYNSVTNNSAFWYDSYNVLAANSAIWSDSASVVISDIAPSATKKGLVWWDSSIGNSYIWYDDGNSQQWVPLTNINALMAYFFSSSGGYISLPPITANWESTYVTVLNNSANWGSSSNTAVSQNSANWQSVYNNSLENSAFWSSTYNTVQINSANWGDGANTIVANNSANWQSVYNNSFQNSGLWNATYNIVSTNSANWRSTYNTVNFNSGDWEAAYDLSVANDLYLKQLMGTGLIQGGTISLNADPTKFNIASGIGYIVDNWTNPSNPVFTTVTWNASSGITDLHINEYISTDLLIDKNGNLIQQIARVSQNDLRDYIFLGRTVHPNLSSITTVASLPHVRTNLPLLVDDLISAIGVINITGNVITASGTNLSLKRSAGSIFRIGSNFTNNPKIPNTTTLNAADPVSLLYRYRNGLGGYSTQAARTTVIPTLWDNGSGTLQTIPNKYFSVQRIYQFTTGLTYITYGQAIYDSLIDAIEAIGSENPDIDVQLNDACLLAYLVVREDTTDLTNALESKIITAGKFSGTGGGASSSGGNVTGPLFSNNNAIARFDGTTGSFIKDGANSTIDDNGNAVFAGTLSTGGIIYDNTGFNSTIWNNTYNTVNAFSAGWGGAIAPQTFLLSSLIIATNVTNGVVNKTYDTTVKPTNMVLISAITDTTPTNLAIHWDGPMDKWMGQPLVSGIAVPLSSTDYLGTTSFSRRFSATIPLNLQNGINIIPLKLESYQKNIQIQLLGAGPEITNVTFGALPGTQTELKNGDNVSMTVEFNTNDVTEIQTFASNNVYASNAQTYAVTSVSNSATVILTIATTTTSLLNLPVRLRAKNSFGTYGTTVNSNAIKPSATLPINNLAPTFGTFSVTYPSSQTALKGTENATASLTVSNAGAAPIYAYSSPNGNLNIPQISTYNATKSVSCTNPGTYNVSGDGGVTNYRLTVTRTENARSSTSDNIVDIADTPAVITVSEPSTRLRSGGTNGTSPQQYTITITSSQRLLNAPSLTESPGAGTFVSSWSYSSTAKTFTNTLQVQDTDLKGTFNWTSLLVKNKANTSTTIINGDSTYVLGGYVIRTLTFSSLSRTVSIGTRVADSTKVTGDETFRGTVTLSAIPNGTVLDPDINTGINITSRFTIVSSASPNIVNNNGDVIFYLDRVAVNQNVGGTANFTTQETI